MKLRAPSLLLLLGAAALGAACGGGDDSPADTSTPPGAGSAGAPQAGAAGSPQAGAAGNQGGAGGLAAGAGGAGAGGAGQAGEAGKAGAAGAPPEPVVFEPCSLFSEGDGPEAECATLKVPLDHKAKEGETIDFFVKRYRPKGGQAKRALWMLQGGPGGSGYVYEKLSDLMADKYPDVEFYMPDHRGTGRSQKLTCSALGEDTPQGIMIDPSEWPACTEEVKATWGSKLEHFSITNAANDLGVAIERTRREGQPVFVLGISYGTTWAHRYLQLYPSQVDGVVLDSMAPPSTVLSNQDRDCNLVAKDMLDRCGSDEFCSKKLGSGGEPWARAEALRDKVKEGHCPAVAEIEGYSRNASLRFVLGNMLMDVRFRNLVPAVIYRYDRCTDDDAKALNQVISAFFAPQDLSQNEMLKQWGWILSDNIIFSEMWETPAPPAETFDAIRENAVASREILAGRASRQASWPKYAHDEYTGKWAETQTPMLMMQGGLDPATPAVFAKEMGDHFKGPHQHYLFFPDATHTTLSSTATTQKRSCATMTMMHFIEDPQGPLDTSCYEQIVPFSFEKNTYSFALFGQTDPWENK